MNNTIKLNHTAPERSPDWIDALAHRAATIGKWDVEGFWPRLANLAFHAVLLNRLLGETDGPRWDTPLTPTQRLAAEHLADRLSACCFVTTDAKGEPDIDISATKAVWTEAAADLPRAFCAPSVLDRNTRGRWFVQVAAAIAEDFAAANPTWSSAVHNRFYKFTMEERFLLNRVCKWTYPRGPIAGLEKSGVEFIHHLYGVGSEHSSLYSSFFIDTQELHDGARINWNFGVWLRIGWDLGHRLTEESSKIGIPRLSADMDPENLVFARDLVGKLTANSGHEVTFDAVASGCIAYIRGRLGVLKDGHSPAACVHALDYAFWMALGVRGLLPAPADTKPTVTAITDASAESNTVNRWTGSGERRRGIYKN